MIRKNKKNILKLLLLIGIFSFNFDNVKAVETKSDRVGAYVCIDGYYHYFSVDKEHKNLFGKISGLHMSDLPQNQGYIDIDGVRVEFYEKSSRYGERCYTVVQEGNSNVDDSTSYPSSQNQYTSKSCLNLFNGNDLVFDKSSGSTNIVNENDGTISLIVRPKKNSSLESDSIWNRIDFDVSYFTSGNKGQCEKGSDKNGKYIKCSGITPAQVGGSASNYTLSFSIKGVNATDFSEKVSLEEKQKYAESCGGNRASIYLTTLSTTIMNQSEIQIKNPALTDPELKALCEEVDALNKSTGINKTISKCSSATVYYTEKNLSKLKESLKESIQSQLEYLKLVQSIQQGSSGSTSGSGSITSDLSCTNSNLGIPSNPSDNTKEIIDKKIVYADSGTYWRMVCEEKYYVDAGIPKLVAAGTAVDFSNKVQIVHECTIENIKQVEKLPQCEYEPVYDCTTTTVPGQDETIIINNGKEIIETALDAGHGDFTTTGGPSTMFDSCITQCDGGKYTQNCINRCYTTTYNSNNRSEILSKMTPQNFNFSKKYELTKIADIQIDQIDEVLTEPGVKEIGKTGYFVHWEANDHEEIFSVCELGYDGAGNLVWELDENGNFKKDKDGNFICTADPKTQIGGWVDKIYITSPTGEILHPGWKEQTQCNDLPVTGRVTITKIPPTVNMGTGEKGPTSSTNCKIVDWNVYPDPCSDDPDGDYNREIEASEAELRTYRKIAEEMVNGLEEYSIGFEDSVTHNVYKITGNTTGKEINGPQLDITEIEKTQDKDEQTITIGVNEFGSALTSVIVPVKITTRTTYNIELPLAQVYKNQQSTVAVENSKTGKHYTYGSSADSDGKRSYFRFSELTNYNSGNFYPGKRAYYTDINSPFTNVAINSGVSGKQSAILQAEDKTDIYTLAHDIDNIFITVKVGGSEEYASFDSKDLACYYGVYPLIIDDDKDHSEGKNIKTSGLRYYYREIDLKDVFPNDRDPRSNWQDTVTGDPFNADYVINASRLIEDIEKKNDSIFTDSSEIDYQFVMTPALIKEIRSYNKGTSNLEFSLASDSTSKYNFSQKVAEWYPTLNTKRITDCNNAKGGTCVNYK